MGRTAAASGLSSQEESEVVEEGKNVNRRH